ncbi:MAG: hypothetical protein FWG84_07385 [Bacteroidales bacterium]|nr:hypothetical protein [Bacteroidales bacterium]
MNRESKRIICVAKRSLVSIGCFIVFNCTCFAQEATETLSPAMYDYLALMDRENVLLKMKAQDNKLYQEYKVGEEMHRNGRGLIVLGSISTLVGIAAVASGYSSYDNNDNLLLLGYGLLGISDILFAIGIPTAIVGKHKQKNALEEFRQQFSLTSPTSSHFQLNLHATGIGVAYVF